MKTQNRLRGSNNMHQGDRFVGFEFIEVSNDFGSLRETVSLPPDGVSGGQLVD